MKAQQFLDTYKISEPSAIHVCDTYDLLEYCLKGGLVLQVSLFQESEISAVLRDENSQILLTLCSYQSSFHSVVSFVRGQLNKYYL